MQFNQTNNNQGDVNNATTPNSTITHATPFKKGQKVWVVRFGKTAEWDAVEGRIVKPLMDPVGVYGPMVLVQLPSYYTENSDTVNVDESYKDVFTKEKDALREAAARSWQAAQKAVTNAQRLYVRAASIK